MQGRPKIKLDQTSQNKTQHKRKSAKQQKLNKNAEQKKDKSNPTSKSKSGDLTLTFTSTIHYHHEALELGLIIQTTGLLTEGIDYEKFQNSK